MLNTKGINQSESNRTSIVSKFRFLNTQSTYLILVIILIAIVASIINPNFLTVRNLFNVLQQISVLGIMTMCMSLLMISRGLDVSIGDLAGLVAIIFAKMLLAEKYYYICSHIISYCYYLQFCKWLDSSQKQSNPANYNPWDELCFSWYCAYNRGQKQQ